MLKIYLWHSTGKCCGEVCKVKCGSFFSDDQVFILKSRPFFGPNKGHIRAKEDACSPYNKKYRTTRTNIHIW